MIKRIARWLLSDELLQEYLKGWSDGVNQQRYEPNTCTDAHISYSKYWHGIEGEQE